MDGLVAYYPWLAPHVAGATDPSPRRAPRPAAGAPPHRPPARAGSPTRRRRGARRAGYSLLPLLFVA